VLGSSNRSELVRDAALALAVGLGACWQLLFSPGVVGLVHDWSIYPFADQHLALAAQMFDGWYEWGLGTPVVYPTEYPFRFVLAAFAALHANGALLSKAIVIIVPAVAFFTMARFIRSLGMPSSAGYFSGLLYAGCPVMLNKLVSGQASYLLGYAFMPLFVLLLLRTLKLRMPYLLAGAVATGAALALVTIQLQLGLLGIGLLILIVMSTPAVLRSRFITASVVLATLVVCEAPTIIGLRVGSADLVGGPLTISGIDWFRDQSVDPWEALRLAGYISHYDAMSVSSYSTLWVISAWGIICIVIAGLIAAPRSIRILATAIFLILFPVVMGSKSAIGFYVQGVLLSVPVLSVFRELYHLMAGIAFAYALLSAFAISWFLRSRFRIALCVAAASCLAVYVSPVLRGDGGGLLRTYTFDSYLKPAFARENTAATRAAWFPLDQPLSFDGAGTGVDPLSVSRRGSLWLYRLSWPLTTVDTYARMGDSRLEGTLEKLGVGDAISRPRFGSRLSDFTVDPAAARTFFGRPLNLQAELGHGTDVGNGVLDYHLRTPLPKVSYADAIVLMPRAVNVWSHVDSRWAAASFDAPPPHGLRYAVLYEPQDFPEEILEASQLDKSVLTFTSVDARRGFAPISLWWWLRPAYADVPDGLLAIGRNAIDERINESGAAVLVYAWRCTPFGGRLRITAGAFTRAVNTRCASSEDVSRSVVIDDAKSVRVESSNARGEVLVRGVSVVPVATWNAAVTHWQHLLGGAARSIDLSSVPMPRIRRELDAVDLRTPGEAAVVYNETYSDDWKLSKASGHFPSLIGTNIFVVRRAALGAKPIYMPGAAFHAAFVCGMIVLILGLVCPVFFMPRGLVNS
jgi:hypothetical protein